MKNFDQLYAELRTKADNATAGSHTVAQLQAGPHEIGKKIVEEAAEVWMAAEYQSESELAEEISQLIYHVQVMMISRGLDPDDIYRVL